MQESGLKEGEVQEGGGGGKWGEGAGRKSRGSWGWTKVGRFKRK